MKRILCTCGGLGFLPKAPGTWGSLPPLLIVLVCGHFGLIQGWIIALLLALLVVSSIVTIKLAPWYSRYFGKTDPPQVVSDEVARPVLESLRPMAKLTFKRDTGTNGLYVLEGKLVDPKTPFTRPE